MKIIVKSLIFIGLYLAITELSTPNSMGESIYYTAVSLLGAWVYET